MNARCLRPLQQRAASLLLSLCVAPAVLSAEIPAANAPAGDGKSIATLKADRGLLEWTPVVDHEGISLALADPQGQVRTFNFARGEAPVLPLVDAQGVPFADGTYTWEIRLKPAAGTSPARALVQSGHFTVVDGSVVPPNLIEPPERGPGRGSSGPRATTAADQIVPDDFIVDGKGCIGLGCVNNEAFGAEALRLKQSVVRLRFEDTSTAGGFPARDWQLTTNDSASGGADRFSIDDLTAGTTPVTIRGGAPNNSLYVDAAGNVGLGTATPAVKLLLYGTATSQILGSIGPDAVSGPAFNFGYGGVTFGRSSGFLNVRPDSLATAPNPSLRFLTTNQQRVIIDNEGYIGLGSSINPAHPIEQQGTGARLTTGGAWVNGSSRAIKQDIHQLEAAEALAALISLEPMRFRYVNDPHDEALGFVAEDVPDLVATPDRKTLSSMDFVALLTRVVQEQEKRIAELEVALAELQREKPRCDMLSGLRRGWRHMRAPNLGIEQALSTAGYLVCPRRYSAWKAVALAGAVCLPEHAGLRASSGSCGDVGGVFYDCGRRADPQTQQLPGLERLALLRRGEPFLVRRKALNPSCNPSAGGLLGETPCHRHKPWREGHGDRRRIQWIDPDAEGGLVWLPRSRAAA